MTSVLVTGATGQLGRRVVRALAAWPPGADPGPHGVRTTGPRRRDGGGEPQHRGRAAAGGRRDSCDRPLRHLPAELPDGRRRRDGATAAGRARDACRPLVAHVCIVGIDLVPTESHRSKLSAEEAVVHPGLPWTVLRTTQCHPFVLQLLDPRTGLPVVPVPGASAAAPRTGASLVPGKPAGGRTWRELLDGRPSHRLQAR